MTTNPIGHYRWFARCQNGDWLCYDDSTVQCLPRLPSSMEQDAYLVVCEHTDTGADSTPPAKRSRQEEQLAALCSSVGLVNDDDDV